MKKVSVVVLVALLFSMVTYGEDLWQRVGAGDEIAPKNGILYVGIGTTSPSYPLEVVGMTKITGMLWQCNANVYLGMGENYKVGIGTLTPDYKLDVNGTIRAKEIIVETGWSDFVFADNYQLMPLDKLERHIKVNKSLPGIPTEKEVLENGVSLGEMQTKLLAKVEELTLYVIELKKENEELKTHNGKLEKRISILERQ